MFLNFVLEPIVQKSRGKTLINEYTVHVALN